VLLIQPSHEPSHPEAARVKREAVDYLEGRKYKFFEELV
jgi:hypothetical protein